MKDTPTPEPKRNAYEIALNKGQNRENLWADALVSPYLKSANNLQNLYKKEELELMPVIESLQKEVATFEGGDTSKIEAMLLTQAHVLNGIFCHSVNYLASAEYLNQRQTHANIALKAQNMCRMTIATLAEMKNPKPTTFIKNTAHNQQINLGAQAETNSAKNSNELISEAKNETVDFRGAGETGGTHSELEAMENSRGENT